jgi:hypothetical protein
LLEHNFLSGTLLFYHVKGECQGFSAVDFGENWGIGGWEKGDELVNMTNRAEKQTTEDRSFLRVFLGNIIMFARKKRKKDPKT